MSSSSIWALKGVAGEFEGNTLPLKPPMMTIGRTTENHVVINDNNVSRQHAVIYVDQHNIEIQDKKSRNGVFVNDQRIDPTKKFSLKHGDRIQIGPHSFIVELDDKARNQTKLTQTKKMPNSPSSDSKILSESEFLNRSYGSNIFDASKFPRAGVNRRVLIYVAMAVVISIIVAMQMFPGEEKKAKIIAPTSNVEISQLVKTPSAALTNDELESLQASAKASMQFQDYLAATELYEKIMKALPSDAYSKSQYEFSKKQLKRLIERHLEFAKREYEKLNYERAIIEWKQALALTSRADPEVYKQTAEKIKDAEKEMRKRK